MVSANNGINDTVGASISGVTNTLTITNPSNTASSSSRSLISVGGGSSGNPYIDFKVASVTDFAMGIDNSASDSFKISASSSLGSTDTFIMTTSGERTMPLQPCFSAYLASTDLNVTGDNTPAVLGVGTPLTILFDQGGNFNTNGTFTAPVTGKYLFLGDIIFYQTTGPISSSFTQGRIDLVTTSKTWVPVQFNPYAFQNAGGGCTAPFSVIASMTAGDTAYVSGTVSGGTKTIDFRGGSSLGSYFCGMLLC